MIELLEQAFKDYGFDQSVYSSSFYIQFMNAVLEKNLVMNLTGITDESAFIYKHFIDSLSILTHYPITQKHKVMDIGTGAGFPGVPIKLYTDCDMTLLDALNKRIKFIIEAVEPYGMKRYQAIHGRAEDFGNHKDYRGQYDFVLTRAVAHLRVLSELSIPFLKVDGLFIALKGPQYAVELKECETTLEKLGAVIHEVYPFTIGEYDLKHTIVVIKKTSPTNLQYPRKFSFIQTNPL